MTSTEIPSTTGTGTGAVDTTGAAGPSGIVEPRSAFAFQIVAKIQRPLHIGHSGSAALSFTPITGGTVTGPRLQGEVLAGGGDWAVFRSDGVFELDARYLVRAADGSVIDIVNRGFWAASAEVGARVEAGEDVDPHEYYFRTQPVFRTDAPAHAWLTRTVFFGIAYDETPDEQIRIEFYEVL